ncbi:MAG: LamG-like jellyroll fold domain-containing protein [Ginsengibacter sp.]
MKNICIKNMLLIITGSIILISCYKSFDSKDYRPTFTIGGYASSSDIGAGHLVGYWAFDGSYIDSISRATGTPVNTGFTTGFKGQALQGAANGYVIYDLPAAIKNLKSFTIDFWINTAQNTNGIITPVCISNDADFWGALDFFYENGSTASSASFKVHYGWQQKNNWFPSGILANPWNAWQNIAVTYNAATSTFNMYQGGSLVTGGSQTVAGLGNVAFPAGANKIIFGTEQFQCTPSIGTSGGPQGWADYLKGQMDEVRVYDVALTASDLQALVILQGKGK